MMIKRKLPLYLFYLFLLLVFVAIFSSTNAFNAGIIETLNIWLYYVYPSIFTFYIIASCLINFNMIAKISSIAKPFIKFNSQKAYELFIISILVGNPSSASLIIKELEYKSININEANKLLKVCSFFNPLFIISVITIGLHTDILYAIIVIVSIIISNIIIGFFIKNKKQDFVNNTNKLILFNPERILISINDCLYLLLNVAGIMVFSNILKFSIENVFSLIEYHNLTTTILISSIEVSTGALDIVAFKLPLSLTIAMLTMLLSFQGVSINLQVFNTIKNHEIRFYPIFITRLIQSGLAFGVALILSNILILTK